MITKAKLKTFEWSQYYTSIFKMRGGMRLRFEHIQTSMFGIITCKNEEDQLKKRVPLGPGSLT